MKNILVQGKKLVKQFTCLVCKTQYESDEYTFWAVFGRFFKIPTGNSICTDSCPVCGFLNKV